MRHAYLVRKRGIYGTARTLGYESRGGSKGHLGGGKTDTTMTRTSELGSGQYNGTAVRPMALATVEQDPADRFVSRSPGDAR